MTQPLRHILPSPKHFLLAAFFFALCSSHPLYAQISHGGTPYSFTHAVQAKAAVATMPAVDVAALRAEDRVAQQQDRPIPPRFGAALDVSLGLQNAGKWTTLPNGDRLWRLRIASQGSYSINLIFDRFHLPPGGKLFIYNEDKNTVLGAFTEGNNKPYGRFSTLPVEGAAITLEYYEPKSQRGNTELRVATVVHAYRNLFGKEKSGVGTNDFGDSGSCNINVSCPEGDDWQDENNAVAMVLVDNNTRYCTGALVNNERDNFTPYFLTANHCYTTDPTSGGVSDWVFWFDYESSSCSNPAPNPGHYGLSGATLKARNATSDFLLLELSSTPPGYYRTHYAGWNANSSPPRSSVVAIHHPDGDVKKISLDDETVTNVNTAEWRVEDWDNGTTEGGSSGSPLFNENHRIIGQDWYGVGNTNNPCGDKGTGYGKFSYSWNHGLSNFLDPDNTGTTVLNGKKGPRPPAPPTNLVISNRNADTELVELQWQASPTPGSATK